MVRLNCFIEVNPGSRDQVIADALALTEHSREEKGCIAYDIFASQSRPEVLMICETWADRDSLDAHASTDVFARYVGNIRANSKMKTESFEF